MRVNFHFLIRSELSLFPRGVHLEIESLILDLVEFSFSLKFCNFYVGPTLLTNSNNPVLSPLHFFFSKNFLPLSSLLFSLPLTLSLKKLIPTKFCSSFFYISSRSKSSIGEANSEHNLGRSVFFISLSLSLSLSRWSLHGWSASMIVGFWTTWPPATPDKLDLVIYKSNLHDSGFLKSVVWLLNDGFWGFYFFNLDFRWLLGWIWLDLCWIVGLFLYLMVVDLCLCFVLQKLVKIFAM